MVFKRNAKFSSLRRTLETIGDFDSIDNYSKRRRDICLLRFLANSWIRKEVEHLPYPQKSEPYGGKLFTSGSYRLGVHAQLDDVDVLFAIPWWLPPIDAENMNIYQRLKESEKKLPQKNLATAYTPSKNALSCVSESGRTLISEALMDGFKVMKDIMQLTCSWKRLFDAKIFPIYSYYVAITVRSLLLIITGFERQFFERFVCKRAKAYEKMSCVELVHINCEPYTKGPTQTWLIGLKLNQENSETIDNLSSSLCRNYGKVKIRLLDGPALDKFLRDEWKDEKMDQGRRSVSTSSSNSSSSSDDDNDASRRKFAVTMGKRPRVKKVL
nr:poly(A) polymerase gamma [Hymenolepis microstoma]